MHLDVLKSLTSGIDEIKLGRRKFEVRASTHVGPLTWSKDRATLTARDLSTVKVTEIGLGYRYEIQNNGGGLDPILGVLSDSKGGVGTSGSKGCVITASADGAGWAGIASARRGKVEVKAGEGNVQTHFAGAGSVEAYIETRRGKIEVKDEDLRHISPGASSLYYGGSVFVTVKRAGGTVNVLIGNREGGKPFVVIVTVNGETYRGEINGDKLLIGVEEKQLLIIVDNIAVVAERLASSY